MVVAVCRVLDDGTFATLSSLMMFNNVEVLVALTQSATFFPDLFRRLSSGKAAAGEAADAEWVDHVSFLQVCVRQHHSSKGRYALSLLSPSSRKPAASKAADAEWVDHVSFLQVRVKLFYSLTAR